MTDPQLSFQLAQVVPDLDFRQVLLATRSEADRMRRLAEFFPNYSAGASEIQHVRAVAPHQRAFQEAGRPVKRTATTDRRRRRHAVGEQHLLRARLREILRFSGPFRLRPQEVRGVLDEIETVNSQVHGYGTANFARNLTECYHQLVERDVHDADLAKIMSFTEQILHHPIELIAGVKKRWNICRCGTISRYSPRAIRKSRS